MRVLLVVPTYNESATVVEVLRRVRFLVPDVDVLVVDDASPDGTAGLAEAVGRELGGVEVLLRPAKMGLGSAYRAGFRRGLDAGYDAFVEMDADLSHDPAVLPLLLETLEEGADLAVGSRYVPGGRIPDWSWRRRALSRWGNRYARFALGLRLRDATSGFRAYRRSLLEAIGLESVTAEGYGFQLEMAYRAEGAGARVVEIPIEFRDRAEGCSKMSGAIVVEALALVTWWGLRDALAGRRRRPTRAPAGPVAGSGPGSAPAGRNVWPERARGGHRRVGAADVEPGRARRGA